MAIMLPKAEKATLSGTLADLRKLTLAGYALLRGNANIAEEHAMAQVCNPGKTQYVSRDMRGFLAFQSTLDRASHLLHEADKETGILTVETHSLAEIPRDALIASRNRQSELTGNAGIVNAYAVVQAARNVYVALKAKYTTEQLAHPGTVNLNGKARTRLTPVEKATMALKGLTAEQRRALFRVSETQDQPVVEATQVHPVVEATQALSNLESHLYAAAMNASMNMAANG
jgi:hypothetical protein